MIALACPFCSTRLELDVVIGAQEQWCDSCGRAFWLSVAPPSVSTTPPKAERHAVDTSSTLADLGPGVATRQTVVGLKPVGAATREGERITRVPTPQLGDVADFPTQQRPLPAFEAHEKLTDRRRKAHSAEVANEGDVPLGDVPLDVTIPPGRPSTAVKKQDSRRRLSPGSRRPGSGFVEPAAQAAPGMNLGGLELLARIGGGGMGTVWLARQLSLDRNVAVKILRPHLGGDPAFVIQFTREALAAAQLVHHNIVQIYDIGLEHELHYFSMEYVEGESLSALLKREGRLDPEVAAGYVLQAARGLQFAHDREMIHRDIKPENLLLNRDGIVKVADLGLVKHLGERGGAPRETSSTVADLDFASGDQLMGTPAYMAPEQVLDPTAVDARADIYALGCTLYDLLTGRPPFECESTGQVLVLHVTQAPVPPSERNHRVDAQLSAIVLKMMAKQTADRFQDLGEVVTALEGYLGIDGAAIFSPREEHAALLERSVRAFGAATWARRRKVARAGFFALFAAVVLGSAFFGFPGFAAWSVLFIGTTALTSFLINAFAERSPLLLRLRHLLLGAPLWNWAIAFGVLLLGVGLLAWTQLLEAVGQNLGLAAALGLASYFALDRRVARERRPFVKAVEEMLKSMRLKGLEEQRLRQFVCRYSGAHWEEFYEALFGYDAKLDGRARWAADEKGIPRKRFGAWRDPLVRLIERRLARRQALREAALLQGAGETRAPALPSTR